MFVGHYSAALAAKAAEPRAPLWSYVVGCELLDVGWATLILAGVEKARVDPTLPGSPLVLHHMPSPIACPARWPGQSPQPWRCAGPCGGPGARRCSSE
ncbi:hypothetical protein [Phenylobacterium sp.]|uniref:hypothetical protein n=1 Tax=Phenylobacterium sp. TaxID=1871053 RepID=UPI002F4050FC